MVEDVIGCNIDRESNNRQDRVREEHRGWTSIDHHQLHMIDDKRV